MYRKTPRPSSDKTLAKTPLSAVKPIRSRATVPAPSRLGERPLKVEKGNGVTLLERSHCRDSSATAAPKIAAPAPRC
jgi:hypothetical protein